MTAGILTEVADGIMTVRFNRLDKKNAITHDMYTALARAVRTADTDRTIRVVVVTGTGDSFSAGNDLKEFIESPPSDPNAPVFQFMTALSTLRKPAIAAVNGIAIGIGVTLLLHCDFVYAVPGAHFQLPFVSLALAPEFGSSLLLTRLIGARKATELLLLGEPFTAERALADGLVNAVVPPEQLMATAMAKARVLAAMPPGALRLTKGLMRADLADITARMELENKAFSERLTTPEFKEAVKAFFEKRDPDYSRFD